MAAIFHIIIYCGNTMAAIFHIIIYCGNTMAAICHIINVAILWQPFITSLYSVAILWQPFFTSLYTVAILWQPFFTSLYTVAILWQPFFTVTSTACTLQGKVRYITGAQVCIRLASHPNQAKHATISPPSGNLWSRVPAHYSNFLSAYKLEITNLLDHHTRTYKHMHARTHAHAHTYTHTYTHRYHAILAGTWGASSADGNKTQPLELRSVISS